LVFEVSFININGLKVDIGDISGSFVVTIAFKKCLKHKIFKTA
jgi:hypothetical protein